VTGRTVVVISGLFVLMNAGSSNANAQSLSGKPGCEVRTA
jgi:hypothetical protein